jgi:hypothetical protein
VVDSPGSTPGSGTEVEREHASSACSNAATGRTGTATTVDGVQQQPGGAVAVAQVPDDYVALMRRCDFWGRQTSLFSGSLCKWLAADRRTLHLMLVITCSLVQPSSYMQMISISNSNDLHLTVSQLSVL